MHCSTSSSSSRAPVIFVTVLALFTSICVGVPAAGSSALFPRAKCTSSHNYTILAGETCQTLAQKHSVSTNDIIAQNCLNPRCTNLIANSTIILPGCCHTHTVKQGENCTSIASSARNLTLADFYAFNPTLHSNCSSLLFGTNVCLTAPKGTPFSAPACPAQNTSSTSAVTPPPSIAPGTSPSCLPLHTAKTGDTCSSIASGNNTSHFLQINPSVNSGCTNLVAGREYCVSPP